MVKTQATLVLLMVTIIVTAPAMFASNPQEETAFLSEGIQPIATTVPIPGGSDQSPLAPGPEAAAATLIGYPTLLSVIVNAWEHGPEYWTLFDLSTYLVEAVRTATRVPRSICTLVTAIDVLYPNNKLVEQIDYVCTWGTVAVASAAAAGLISGGVLASSGVGFLVALIPAMLDPEKYIDPRLGPINEWAWSMPLTCTVFPELELCGSQQDVSADSDTAPNEGAEAVWGIWHYDDGWHGWRWLTFYPDGSFVDESRFGYEFGTYVYSAGEIAIEGFRQFVLDPNPVLESFSRNYILSGNNLLETRAEGDTIAYDLVMPLTVNSLAYCAGSEPSRLMVGFGGFVDANSAIGRARQWYDRPSFGALTTAIPEDPNRVLVSVVGGPVCADGVTWWEVEDGPTGSRGWLPEHDGGERIISPLPRVISQVSIPDPTTEGPGSLQTTVPRQLCPNTPFSRLVVGQPGRVAFTDGSSTRLRNGPGTNYTILLEMPEGTEFAVMAGPECEEYAWWRVQLNDGLVGWVAEGRDSVYFVEPIYEEQSDADPAAVEIIGGWTTYHRPGTDPMYATHPYPSLDFCADGRFDAYGVAGFTGNYEFVGPDTIRVTGYGTSEHGTYDQATEWFASVSLGNGMLYFSEVGAPGGEYQRSGEASCR